MIARGCPPQSSIRKSLMNNLLPRNFLDTVYKSENRLLTGYLRQVRTYREYQFTRQVKELVRAVKRSPEPKGLVAFNPMDNMPLSAVSAMLMQRLGEIGWGVTLLGEDGLLPKSGDPKVRAFDGILVQKNRTTQYLRGSDENAPLQHEWIIDLDKGRCEAKGIEFYPLFWSLLTRWERRYFIDPNHETTRKRFEALLHSADAMLTVVERLERFSLERDLPVRIIAPEPLYPPSGIFNFYCREYNRKNNLEFFDIEPAYEGYFKGGKGTFFSTFTGENLTRHKLFAAVNLRKERFDAWLAQKHDVKTLVNDSKALLDLNRTNRKLNSESDAIVSRIERHKLSGGRVLCAFGLLLYDLGVPKDHGPAHQSMSDWVTHTVNLVKNSDDLLLVKPHMVEAQQPKFDQPIEVFADLLPKPLPKNVIVLDPLAFNLNDILPFLDLAIVWRGTVALELAMMKVPVIAAAHFQVFGNIVTLPQPVDNQDYCRMVKEPNSVKLSDEQAETAALYLQFLKSSDNFLPFPYATFGKKKKIPPFSKWHRKQLQSFRPNGDSTIQELCARIIA